MRTLTYKDGQVLTVEQIEADMAADRADSNARRVERGWPTLPDGPDPRWVALKEMMQPGDQVRWYAHVQGPRSAQLGFELVRRATVIGRYMVAMA